MEADLENEWNEFGTHPLDVSSCLQKYKQISFEADIASKSASSCFHLYSQLRNAEMYKNVKYLTKINSPNIIRTFSLLRLRNVCKNSFLLYNDIIRFKIHDLSCKCELLENETFEHVIFKCLFYDILRTDYFSELNMFEIEKWFFIPDSDSPNIIHKCVNMITAICKLYGLCVR